jgi:tetratricopeptide (TPR) repeat protein
MKTTPVAFLFAVLIVLAPSMTYAADATPAAPRAVDKLKAARTEIDRKNWNAAIAELKSVNDTGSADWNNLMGYSLRKATPPDYAAAEKYYDEALRIDPKHRGALEYSGELYLMQGNLPKAEERLAALDKICFFPCEEYTDLKQAVDRYKATASK